MYALTEPSEAWRLCACFHSCTLYEEMDDVHQLNKGVDGRDFFDEDGNNLYGNDTDKADDEELEIAIHLIQTTT